jgi:hypothetical protein
VDVLSASRHYAESSPNESVNALDELSTKPRVSIYALIPSHWEIGKVSVVGDSPKTAFFCGFDGSASGSDRSPDSGELLAGAFRRILTVGQ